jgi:hypothetical protein
VDLEREAGEESGGGGPAIGEDSHWLIAVASRCGRVDPSATSGRAFQRATVRGWMPSSRASAAREAVHRPSASAASP